MFQIVYASSAVKTLDERELIELVVSSRKNNRFKGITGMLVHCGGEFLQALQGEPSDVVDLFDRISIDTRHVNVVVLHRGYATRGKSFRSWFMGFQNLTSVHDLPAEFRRVNGRIDLLQLDGQTAIDFLAASQSNPSSGQFLRAGQHLTV